MMKRKSKGQSMNVGKAALIGCLFSIVVTTIMICLAAYLESVEIISESLGDGIIIGIQFVSAAVGSVIAIRNVESGFLIASLLTVLLYFMILASISIAIFEGTFSSVLNGLLAVTLGAILALGTFWFRNKRTNSRRKWTRSR